MAIPARISISLLRKPARPGWKHPGRCFLQIVRVLNGFVIQVFDQAGMELPTLLGKKKEDVEKQ